MATSLLTLKCVPEKLVFSRGFESGSWKSIAKDKKVGCGTSSADAECGIRAKTDEEKGEVGIIPKAKGEARRRQVSLSPLASMI